MRGYGGRIGSFVRPTRAAAGGIFTMDQVSENVIDTTWPILTDANFASVTILIHGDDQEGFVSAGTTTPQHWRNNASGNHSIPFALGTNNNGPALSSGSITAKFGSTIIKVNNFGLGTNSVTADCAFGTGDFTIEGWFYITTLAAANLVDCRASSASNGAFPTIYCLSNLGSLRYFVSSADKIIGANGTLIANTWQHIILSRVSGTSYLGCAGAQVGSAADTTNFSGSGIFWGSSSNTGPITGYMQELRVTKGVGRYAGGAYSVPTTKFADTA